jgi:hypothetical protein
MSDEIVQTTVLGPDLINLTPHDIHIRTGKEAKILESYPASGYVARALSDDQNLDTALTAFYGFPIVSAQRFTGVEIPPMTHNPDMTGILVSMPVGEYFRAQAEKGIMPDYDVLGPDMGPGFAVRDDKGIPIGTRRLCVYATAPKQHEPSKIHIVNEMLK